MLSHILSHIDPRRPGAVLILIALLSLPLWWLRGQPEEAVMGTELGEPIQGISARNFELFRLGLEDFLEVEDSEEGLGPLFNGRSCAECHSVPRIGGSGMMTEVRAGILHPDGSFEELPGGSLFQLFSIPTHGVQARIPEQANVVARRKPLPLFGDGLVEAVPDEVLLALEDPDDLDGDGVSGRAHRILDRGSDTVRIGRFGWKAQQSSLFTFGAEAYLMEMGITNDLFVQEACPFGVDCDEVNFQDPVADPEDGPDPSTGLRGIDNFANFMRFLGPPPRGPLTPQVATGEQIFHQIRCGSCHVPSLTTGASPLAPLRFKRFYPYGNFLLHDIGTGDGIQQGEARPSEIRTAPLWGVRFRAPFLHDGRASTLREAIELHGGEAEGSRQLFQQLPAEDREALLAFLNSL